MVRILHHNFLGIIIISIIRQGTQGHRHKWTGEQRVVEHETSSQESLTDNNDHVNTGPRMENPVTRVHQITEADSKIIFPSDFLAHTSVPPTVIPTVACTNTTFCEHPSFYPADFIKNAIKMRQDLKFLASVETALEIGQRIDVDNDDQSLCAYEETVVFPKLAENKAKQWLYIVNEDDFPQGVRIETCMTENTACSIIEGFAEGYKTFCKQKYIYRQLAAVSSNGSSLDVDLFRFPASCCCHVKLNTGNSLMRIDGGASPAPRTTVSRADETSPTMKKK